MKSIYFKISLSIFFTLFLGTQAHANSQVWMGSDYNYISDRVSTYYIDSTGIHTATVNEDETSFNAPSLIAEDFSAAQGWDKSKNPIMHSYGYIEGSYSNILLGFHNEGVKRIALKENAESQLIVNDFGYNQGWRSDKHVRLIAPWTGNIVGFGDEGVKIAEIPYEENATFPIESKLVLNDFGYDKGWNNDKHIRTIVAIGTAALAIVGFGDDGVFVSKQNTYSCSDSHEYNTSFPPKKLYINDFGYNQGWRNDKHIRIVDLNYKASYPWPMEIIAFGDDGTYISEENTTTETFEPKRLLIAEFGYDQGWRVDKHLRLYISDYYDQAIIGFKDDGVYVSIKNDDGTFEAPTQWSTHFGYNEGWRNDLHTRMLYDINGDNKKDIVAVKDGKTYVALNTGTSFAEPEVWLEVELLDTDGDGIPDETDTDDDNDGVLDVNDAFPLDKKESVDTDHDGIGNNADTDDDNDGVPDTKDALPLNPNESVDTDHDGIGNNADTDDDNDGISDADEKRWHFNPLNPSDGGNTDTDGDGVSNADEIEAGSNPRDPNDTKKPKRFIPIMVGDITIVIPKPE